MLLGAGIRVELILQLGEQEECLLHGIGDQKDMDEFEILQWRVPVQVLRSDLAHHFAVAAVFATIAEALARGEKVSIAGFGTFATRSRPARQGRNPATGESIAIAASTAPSFKAGKTLRDGVNQQTA